jgi:hypothetical protein
MKTILLLIIAVSLHADCSKLSLVMDKSYYSNIVKVMGKSYYKYAYPADTRDNQVKEINAAIQVKKSITSVLHECNTLTKKNLLALYKIRMSMDKIIVAKYKGE